jgi:hypothetical protein
MTTVYRDGPKLLTLAGREYLGTRTTEPEAGLGHIEIAHPESGKLIARVTQGGNDGSMRVATFGQELRRDTVAALWELAEDALA